MTDDEEDKPTVVLDLNALKKQKLKEEEDLSLLNQELEFSVGSYSGPVSKDPRAAPVSNQKNLAPSLPVILFDFQSDFFQKELKNLPAKFDYHLVKDLPGLNKFLAQKKFQVIIFNYDVSPKAVNQLTSQIKQKFSHAKTLIVAKSISAEKAKIHAKTPSGADGYYQLPFKEEGFCNEVQKIYLLHKQEK